MRSYTIKNKFYGKRYIDRKIYYQGFRKKPPCLKDRGQGFPGGKHLLETLDKKFSGVRLIITPSTDKIQRHGRRCDVFISSRTLASFDAIVRERSRDIKLDAASVVLAKTFGDRFALSDRIESYRRDMFAKVLTDQLDPRLLSMSDVQAVITFATRIALEPRTLGFDERDTVRRKRTVQLLYLKKLIAEYENRLRRNLGENDWQLYFSEKILYFQESYIRKIEKPNIAAITAQFPDFGVITADDFLDLVEIKTPGTPLLSEDRSHRSFYWTSDISRAIAQTESYIESVASNKAEIILKIEKVTGLKLKIMKPRGIIIAGSRAQFERNSEKTEFFRMLNEGLKNVEVIPYDDLARRLRNTVTSIERLEEAAKRRGRKFSA